MFVGAGDDLTKVGGGERNPVELLPHLWSQAGGVGEDSGEGDDHLLLQVPPSLGQIGDLLDDEGGWVLVVVGNGDEETQGTGQGLALSE